MEMLNNAFEGYNACLFAYGQTGSGKSYSVVGYGENKGIVPRACEEIFKRIQARDADPNVNIQHQVTVGMIEIYNEKVQDLLSTTNTKQSKDGLQVRDDPQKGIYVQDQNFVPVSSAEQILAQLDKGNEARTIGSTNMNATSSRAHTIFQIIFKQRVMDENGKPTGEKVSNINMIDLAGSERASSTGAQGARLQEGAKINNSLMVLG